MIAQRPVVETRTEHYACIQWWWKEGFVHDAAYRDKVNTAMQRAVAAVCKRFGVTEDTQLRCQWEGVQIISDELNTARAAGNELAKTLGRFKHVEFIG
ncbi:TPA: hypothetical protein L5U90_003370 [Pseudomonas aeruginosa]|nr:hypothetical protein [Pseudomonas aeruginosa]